MIPYVVGPEDRGSALVGEHCRTNAGGLTKFEPREWSVSSCRTANSWSRGSEAAIAAPPYLAVVARIRADVEWLKIKLAIARGEFA